MFCLSNWSELQVLKQRFITAVVLVSIFLWAVFFWPSQAFIALIVVLCAVGAHEWSALGGIQRPILRACYAITCGSLVLLLLLSFDQTDTIIGFNAVLSLGWLMVFAWLVKLNNSEVPKRPQAWSLVFAPLVMCGVGLSLLWLRDASATGPWLLIYVLAIAWAADIGAYFVGRKFGRRKLSVVLSPGKSVEGALGGLVCAVLLAIVASILLELDSGQMFKLVLISIVSAVFSVGGDLFESSLKRAAGVKDSGWILPGHGGVLDRVDSPLASVPVFVGLSAFLSL